MAKILCFILVGVLIAPMAVADAPSARDQEIAALIGQLGDDNPKVRDAASQKLRRFGAGALAALGEARNSADPEVMSRAQTLLGQIDEDLHPMPVEREAVQSAILRRMQLQRMRAIPQAQQRLQAIRVESRRSVSIKRNADGDVVKDITVSEAGRTVRIHESPDGIAMKTTRIVAGQEESTQIEVKDKAELKKEHPDEFVLYEKYSQTAGDEGAREFRLLLEKR
ncbi:MAG: hypothetical protein JWN40_5060 [Phycisphaerales bacterium]|nr:hypothetical protein [Phycisphaerales bacterium]